MRDELRYSEFNRNDFKHITLGNGVLEVDIVPELGGKMSQLTHLTTGTDFLLPPQTADGKYKKPEYGGDFEQFDTSGFDECFPTVADAEIDVDGEKILFPDHGELWSRSWDVEQRGHSITLSIEGVRWDYTFAKRITFEDNTIIIRYTLVNEEDRSLPFIWSAHPLLQITPDSEILFADAFDEVLVNWASDSRIGSYGDTISWPYLLNDEEVDFSKVPEQSFERTAKLFTPALQEGRVGLYREDADESICFEFDTEEVPYLGLWLCYGGWPVDVSSDQKHMTVGLEPTTGRPDGLDESVKRGECPVLEAGDTTNWVLKMYVEKGKASF
jgi:galactose mutarotase-like enzyme